MSWSTYGALSGAAAVAMGAFGAHGLKASVSDKYYLDIWNTGAHYHLIHSLALVVSPLVHPGKRSGLWAGRMFGAGILLFSGSLYMLTLTENKKWGAVTPIGGLCLIAGWGCLAAGL